MNSNMGKTDRVFRIILGIAIGGAGIFYGSWWGLLAIVPLGTASVAHCPVYQTLGWSTAKQNQKRPH